MKCKECKWWANFEPRVFACISNGHSTHVRNRIELRQCTFSVAPTVQVDVSSIFTDEDFACGSFAPKENIERG